MHSRQVLVQGGLRELVQLVRGECLTGDDNMAYDCSFVSTPKA